MTARPGAVRLTTFVHFCAPFCAGLMTRCNIEEAACDATRETWRRLRPRWRGVGCLLPYLNRLDATRTCKFFRVNKMRRAPATYHGVIRRRNQRRGRRSGRRASRRTGRSLAHSLLRGSPVGSSSAILITTSFSHWIRWRVKIEGAALLVSSGPYPKVTRPRCTFLAALRHLDPVATTANYVSSMLNERQMKSADWRSYRVISRSCEIARNKTRSASRIRRELALQGLSWSM